MGYEAATQPNRVARKKTFENAVLEKAIVSRQVFGGEQLAEVCKLSLQRK